MDSGDAFTFHYNSLFLDFNTGMQNVYTQKGMPIKNHYLWNQVEQKSFSVHSLPYTVVFANDALLVTYSCMRYFEYQIIILLIIFCSQRWYLLRYNIRYIKWWCCSKNILLAYSHQKLPSLSPRISSYILSIVLPRDNTQ